MGRADTATKNFMRQNDVFADAFNFFLYQGYPVIDLGRLRELNPAEIGKEEFVPWEMCWNLSSIPVTKRNWWSGFMRKSRN